MLETLLKNWWLLALRGILAALFSLVIFGMQHSLESFTLRAFATRGLIVFLGLLAFAAGVCTIAAGMWNARHGKWWVLVLDGLAIGAAGIILIASTNITLRMVTYLFLFLAVTIGVLELSGSRMLRRHVPDEWFLGLAGAASVTFAAAFLWIMPEEARSAFVWVACYSGFSAACMLGLALRLRSLRRAVHRVAQSVRIPAG